MVKDPVNEVKLRTYRHNGWEYILNDEDHTAWITKGRIGRCRRFRVSDHIEVDGSVYTNNIEGFWSHFRRMISGCYHDVSDEHLQSYIDEACFRWNTRKMSESERFTEMFNTSIGLVKPNKEFKLCIAA